MKHCLPICAIALLTGCVRFHPQPLSPADNAAALEARSLTNTAVKAVLEENLHQEFSNWPPAQWSMEMLTLAALHYHPDLAVARAQWEAARAAIKSAGERPNPSISLAPEYVATSHNPWSPGVSFDIPIETAGKRGHRIAAAEKLAESARLDLISAAWRVRSDVRANLLELMASLEREGLEQQQIVLQEDVVRLLDQQVAAGAKDKSEVMPFRVSLQKLHLDLAAAQSQRAEARARLAESIGVPTRALAEVTLTNCSVAEFAPLPDELTSSEVRRAALQSRSDILAALADYQAAEARLQTEIAKQYPDVNLSPGYVYDQEVSKWSVGITFDLPVLNQNRGPIAEAEAARKESAARFNALQAKVLAEIDRAFESYRIAQSTFAPLRSLASQQASLRDTAEAQFKAGALDPLDLLSARAEFASAQLAQLEGELRVQQAIIAVEDAIQRPIDLPGVVSGTPATTSRTSGSKARTNLLNSTPKDPR